MKVSVISYSLSNQPKSLKEWEERLITEINDLSTHSKIILYPELFLMGLSDYFVGLVEKQLLDIAAYTYEKLLPKLTEILKDKNILLCLGSGPRVEDDKLYNTSAIWVKDTWVYQDKIHLTPWETSFTPGNAVRLFEFENLRTACIICFDMEQPGLALYLKKAGVDLILCPSATTNKNGNQRVNRCASSRAVELGAAIFTSPLVGQSECELVDHNEGRQGFFLPAQEAVTVEQEQFSEYSDQKYVVQEYYLDTAMLKKLKEEDEETKPYLKGDLI